MTTSDSDAIIRAELAADTESAAGRVFRAEHQDELRRSLREALANLYAWREYERHLHTPRLPGFQGRGWRADVLEALVSWRNLDTHDLSAMVELNVHSILSGDLISSPNLILGAQPHFQRLSEADIGERFDKRRRDAYRILNGQPVTQFIRDAASYLAEAGALPGTESVSSEPVS